MSLDATDIAAHVKHHPSTLAGLYAVDPGTDPAEVDEALAVALDEGLVAAEGDTFVATAAYRPEPSAFVVALVTAIAGGRRSRRVRS